MADDTDWDAVARGLARDAHTHHFHSRRGVWTIAERPGVCVLYDNSPEPRAADARAWILGAAGGEYLAHASWPTDGPDAGYTLVAVVRGEAGALAAAWAAAIGVDAALLTAVARGRPD